MIAWLIMLETGPAVASIDRYRRLTRATPHCEARTSADEIAVCGRRDADRYRVPLIEHDPGDPAHEGVAAERERLLARTSNCREKSLFLVGCGSAGATASAGFGRDGIGTPHLRPMAE